MPWGGVPIRTDQLQTLPPLPLGRGGRQCVRYVRCVRACFRERPPSRPRARFCLIAMEWMAMGNLGPAAGMYRREEKKEKSHQIGQRCGLILAFNDLLGRLGFGRPVTRGLFAASFPGLDWTGLRRPVAPLNEYYTPSCTYVDGCREAIHVATPVREQSLGHPLLFARLAFMGWAALNGDGLLSRSCGWVCAHAVCTSMYTRRRPPTNEPTPSSPPPPPHRSVITCPMSSISARNPSGLFFLFSTNGSPRRLASCQGVRSALLGPPCFASRGSGSWGDATATATMPKTSWMVRQPNIALPLIAMAIEVGPTPRREGEQKTQFARAKPCFPNRLWRPSRAIWPSSPRSRGPRLFFYTALLSAVRLKRRPLGLVLRCQLAQSQLRGSDDVTPRRHGWAGEQTNKRGHHPGPPGSFGAMF